MKYLVTMYDAENRWYGYYVKGKRQNSTWTSKKECATPLSWIRAILLKLHMSRGAGFDDCYMVERLVDTGEEL